MRRSFSNKHPCSDTLSVRTGPCKQVASILHSLDAEGSAESEAVLEEAFATTEGLVEPVEEDEAEARPLAHCTCMVEIRDKG